MRITSIGNHGAAGVSQNADVLDVLVQPTKAASSRGLHFPLFRGRLHCSTWTQGNLCLKPQKYKIIPVLDIFKTWARKYHHKCRSISTLKKIVKAISETEHIMGVWRPTYLLHKIKEMLEGPKYKITFHTVFSAACRWTDLKGSKHLDPWMLAITNKEPVTAEGHHYMSCYLHTHLELGMLPAEL